MILIAWGTPCSGVTEPQTGCDSWSILWKVPDQRDSPDSQVCGGRLTFELASSELGQHLVRWSALCSIQGHCAVTSQRACAPRTLEDLTVVLSMDLTLHSERPLSMCPSASRGSFSGAAPGLHLPSIYLTCSPTHCKQKKGARCKVLGEESQFIRQVRLKLTPRKGVQVNETEVWVLD